MLLPILLLPLVALLLYLYWGWVREVFLDLVSVLRLISLLPVYLRTRKKTGEKEPTESGNNGS